MDVKHSELPWKWDKECEFSELVDAQGNNVLRYTTDDDGIHGKPEDEEFLITAANSYYPDKALIESFASAVVVLPDDAEPEVGDVIKGRARTHNLIRYRVITYVGSDGFHFSSGGVILREDFDRVIQRNGKPVIYESMLKQADLTHRCAIDDVKELNNKEQK